MAKIDQLFNDMLRVGGSDLHLEEGQKPKIRLHGELKSLDYPSLTEASLGEMLSEICSPDQWTRYLQRGDLDFAYQIPDVARFRANFFRQFYGYGAIFRVIPSKILSLADLGAPEVLKSFSMLTSGLVLVTGPTGSGKSTTLAAVINHINETQTKKIMTIEDPVEFVHQSKRSLMIHREVGEDTLSFSTGLMGAIKSDVNVVLVGEMRDRETIELALTATEMGMLVFGTLHTNSAAKTLDRITDAFPTSQQDQIKGLLANTLKGIVSQTLLRSVDGKRRHAAHEILLYTPALSGLLRTGDASAIYTYIQTGGRLGMTTLDDSLKELVRAGKVSQNEAYLKALDKSKFGAAN